MAKIAYDAGLIKEESYENIQESLGVNIGIEYIHDAMEPLGEKITNDSFIKDIAHVDNYIMNCDRSVGNINILQSKSDRRRYYAIDFGNALADGKLYEKILNGDTDIFTTGIFNSCNATQSGRYILKEDTEKLIKRGRHNKQDVSTIRNILENIVNEFPPDWEPVNHKDVILDVIVARLKSKNIFKTTVGSKCICLY